ncbi:MAG: flagellin FliC [Bdellovibrio sp.]|nr:flagellin FliC [Bdellovibrio sp.]
MGFRVNTNTLAMSAQRALGNSKQDKERALSRLSSGERIYEAAQDPSGLAISEKMKSQIRSMGQAERNSQEAITMFQVGEGALGTIHDISSRLRELALQSATDTMGDGERLMVEREFQSLKQEIGRITASTDFNGRKLLDGNGQMYEMQVGINNTHYEKIDYNMANILRKADMFGAASTSVITKEDAQNSIAVVANMIDEISKSRSEIGGITNRMQSAIQSVMISRENLSAANSKIRDADYAQETAASVRAGLLMDSGISSLATINASPSTVLRLVG